MRPGTINPVSVGSDRVYRLSQTLYICVPHVFSPVCGASCLQRTGLGYPDASGWLRIDRLLARRAITLYVRNTFADASVGILNGGFLCPLKKKLSES